MFFQTQIIIKKESGVLDKSEIEEIIGIKENFSIELTINKDPKKSSIGIEELKPLIEWNARKTNTLRASVITNAELITTEGQNSILKVLEEPSQNTLIILVSKSTDAFLRTILSRCHINRVYTDKNATDFTFERFITLNLPERYKFIEEILSLENSHETLSELLEESMQYIVQRHETFNEKEKLSMIELVEESIRAIKSKINLKLVGENFISHTINIK